jgi:DNA (cytosine-5)-methyltransferase 1
MNELHLFAGAGGGILGGILSGNVPVCAVEIDPFCRSVLLQRQRDGILPWFPIWDDVRTFDGKPWKGRSDIVCGGFPCQDISTAGGANRLGLDGKKSGLWGEMARIVREVEPRYVFVENSPALTFRGLGRVLGDLAAMGFDARWGVFSAADVGARHERERIWIIGNNRDSNPNPTFPERRFWRGESSQPLRNMQERWWPSDARMGRKSDGLANWMDRLAALGNGQIPAVAELAWRKLKPRELKG